jgi:hypothetical protein
VSCLLERVDGAGAGAKIDFFGTGGGTGAWSLRVWWESYFIIYSMLKSLVLTGFAGAETFAGAGTFFRAGVWTLVLAASGLGVTIVGIGAGFILSKKSFLIVSADKGFPGDKLRLTGETDLGFCLGACLGPCVIYELIKCSTICCFSSTASAICFLKSCNISQLASVIRW